MPKFRLIAVAALSVVLSLIVNSRAIAKSIGEHWIASSKTAVSITGDIILTPNRLNAAGHDFPLKVAKDLTDYGAFIGSVPARILRVTRKMDPTLLHGNRLGCGHPIQWIVVYRFDKGMLGMDVFDGPDLPTTNTDPGTCGTYTYTRP